MRMCDGENKTDTHLLQNRNGLVEMVVLHGAGAVDAGQWRLGVQHEFVAFASVVQVVTKTTHVEGQTLVEWDKNYFQLLIFFYNKLISIMKIRL
jgi:hypothetical protein